MTVRVLVTGATGFVGQHLCILLAERGTTVRALLRDSSRMPLLSGVEMHRGDITDANAIRLAVRDIDVVVHLAARVHVMRDTASDPLAEFRRVNVGGSDLLATAARDAGVRSFIFASSVKAVGDASTSAWTTTTIPVPKDAYGISKRESEQMLLARSSEQFGVTVLRFPLIYGPGMKGNMLRLFRLIDRGMPVPVGTSDNRRSVLYVGNASAAISRVIDRAADHHFNSLAPGPFFVADGPARSTAALATSIAIALGTSARTIRLPEKLLRRVARIGDSVTSAQLGATLNRLLGSLEVDETEFEDAYDFSPPFTTEAAMDITARWFIQS